jgi:hypothetical protein
MMKQEALFKKLGNILNELNEQYQFLSQNPAQLSELELELFLANANFLTDHIQIIKKINHSLPVPNEVLAEKSPIIAEEPQTIIEEEPIINNLNDVQQVETLIFANEINEEEPIVENDSEEKDVFVLESEPTQTFEFILNDNYSDDDKFEFEEKSVDELFNRPLSKEEERILEQKKKVKENLIRNVEELEEDEIGPEPFLVHKEEEQLPVIEKEKPLEKEPLVTPPAAASVVVEKVIAETKAELKYENDYKPTLNDILAGKNASSNLNDSTTLPVTDLKQAINLNDKLLYIKDLFNGYNLAYAEAIDLANKLPNFEAADAFFQKNYAAKNHWADKQATVDKFYLLLNRRFKD